MIDLDQIYFTARGLPPEERPAYLATACQGDAALRRRVEQMLAVADQAEAFITDPAEQNDKETRRGSLQAGTPQGNIESKDVPDEIVGRKIGRYKILERIGEGGFGVVYVAEQTEGVRRRVALKVIKVGMDTKQVVSRFEAERQALAMMDHPNIAKVLDAGATEAGRPFFVMELVRGIRITDYCNQNNLGTKERLDLFIKVCHAIQHAHQKGIIHRDIKPSNILVTLHDDLAVPKVIDFGIAKATDGRLTDATVYTQFHQLIGTPAYISPEQAEMNGLDVDTRSDIYSLGVLLYELLVGSTPFDADELIASGLDAMRKTIREKEPLRPSTKLSQILTAAGAKRRMPGDAKETAAPSRWQLDQVRHLKGDLDWIVMKCLEKDRTRRYPTANGLAAELERHLTNEPVLACPPSAAYRFQKAFRRNKIMVSAGLAVTVALLLGVIASSWQAIEATRAREAEIKQRVTAQIAQARAAGLQQNAENERQRAEQQLTRAEWLAYAGNLTLAQTDFEAGNGGLAEHYLEQCQPDLRGWEHRYLSTRIKSKQTLKGHLQDVTCVAFGPDGRSIVTGSLDQTARIWDAATGREMLMLTGHGLHVLAVAFSPDGRRIVTGNGWRGNETMPGNAKVWNAETGEEILTLTGHTHSVLCVAFSPDGKRIASGAGDWSNGTLPGEVKVWDAATGHELLTFVVPAAGVRSVAFSPDGRRIVTGTWHPTANVWDAATGQKLLALNGHTHWATSAAFSSDGLHIVTGSDDRTAKVWEAATGQELITFKEHKSRLTGVAFSPDGKRIVTGSADQTTKVWDVSTGHEVFALKGHGGAVFGVALSSDGERIASASGDRTTKIWDAALGQEPPVLKGHVDFVGSLAFSPDGQRLATASGDGSAIVWDVKARRRILTLRASPDRKWTEVGLRGVAFSPDGRRIVTGSQDRTARVWDASSGQELLTLPHAHIVSSVAFSGDGQRIVTGCYDNIATVWNATTGQPVLALKGHTAAIYSVAWSRDGQRIVTGSTDRTAKIWDAAAGQEIFTLNGHTNTVRSVAFSPDGQRIVTGSQDRVARVWDAATGNLILVLKGHTSAVRSVVFSPDGQRIVTGSDDHTAKIWESGTGQELLSLREHADGVFSVAFSPDGNCIVTGIAGANAPAKIWSAVAF